MLAKKELGAENHAPINAMKIECVPPIRLRILLRINTTVVLRIELPSRVPLKSYIKVDLETQGFPKSYGFFKTRF